ncbi:helix-turn-helix domain-containing protein [Polyangium mundeleinium]|uniref:XRE family transcriptional regulator n=1 Tax=Polyangium mundeleinium TaxID=2995306 RepID=A0ABT5F1Z4_9BACT|nr:XRE family transcriptional regulator [Polyangium mundeleinium]MDC0748108.1 XRE family transcriptional regulator [Polyangium mundeleinium]
MSRTTDILREALRSAGLSIDDLARWTRIDLDILRDAEAGRTRLTAAQLDRVACAFGLRLDDLLEGQVGSAPMTLLLRSAAHADRALDIRSVLTTEIDQALGEFQRVVRDIADVENLLGRAPPTLPTIPDRPNPQKLHTGDHRARMVRDYLGLGLSPIRSMRKIVESLGVAIVWVSEDQVDRSVEGACTRVPRPTILVNVIEEGRRPWRARITMAHELGHVLFDLTEPMRQVLVSPHKYALPPPWLDEIERNANAFAACLLAPTDGVRMLVGRIDPTSEDAICVVGEHFGVGRTVAINRLQVVFNLTDVQRASMEYGRQPRYYNADFNADAAPGELGLRGEPFRSLVAAGVESGKLTPYRARSILGIAQTEPLPFAYLPAEMTAPSVSAEQQMLRAASVYLARTYPDAGLVPGEATRDGTAWIVTVFDGGVGAIERAPRGKLVFSEQAKLIVDAVSPALTP